MALRSRTRKRRGIFKANGTTVHVGVTDIRSVLYPTAYAQVLMDCLEFSAKEMEGSVLDLGTGSGVLGIYALLKGCRHVTMTDIVPEALECARLNLRKNQIRGGFELVSDSDMFEGLDGRFFDLIICNPPPLPDIPQLRTGHPIDGAVLSGTDGMAFTERLLAEVDSHLTQNGRLVIARPSFWSRDKTSRLVHARGLSHRRLGRRLLKTDLYPHLDDQQHEAMVKALAGLSEQNGSRFFSVPGPEFTVSAWEVLRAPTP